MTEPAQLDLVFEEVYAHPIEKVWSAVTDTEHLAAWLMQNDFEPRVGKAFTGTPWRVKALPTGGSKSFCMWQAARC